MNENFQHLQSLVYYQKVLKLSISSPVYNETKETLSMNEMIINVGIAITLVKMN